MIDSMDCCLRSVSGLVSIEVFCLPTLSNEKIILNTQWLIRRLPSLTVAGAAPELAENQKSDFQPHRLPISFR
jgi:hypothetical protein